MASKFTRATHLDYNEPPVAGIDGRFCLVFNRATLHPTLFKSFH